MEFIHPPTDKQLEEIQAALDAEPGQGITDIYAAVPLYHVIVREYDAVIAVASLDPRIGELFKLYVVRRHQGKGIGTALVSYVMKLLRERSYNELLVEMTEQSYPFWEKFAKSHMVTSTDYNKISIAISKAE